MADQHEIGLMNQMGDVPREPLGPLLMAGRCGTCAHFARLTDSDGYELRQAMRPVFDHEEGSADGRCAVLSKALRSSVGVCTLDVRDPVALRTCGCLRAVDGPCERESDGIDEWEPSEDYERRLAEHET